MKMRTAILPVVVVLGANLAFAQDYAFRVLMNKGQNQIREGGAWVPLKVGAELDPVDEVKISENACLGLVHISGKPLQLKESGQYTVADLSARIGKGNSVLNRYAEFILSSNTQASNRLAATGSVVRGFDRINVHLPPSSFYFFGDTVVIAWDNEEKIPGPFEVVLSNIWGDVVEKMVTEGHSVVIGLTAGALARQNDILIRVTSTKVEKASDDFILRKFSAQDRARVDAAFGEIASQIAASTALNRIIEAGFFEEKKLLADAATAFQQAIALEPDFPELREDYEKFLLRNGMKAPPEK